jgi:hypothetical protein
VLHDHIMTISGHYSKLTSRSPRPD